MMDTTLKDQEGIATTALLMWLKEECERNHEEAARLRDENKRLRALAKFGRAALDQVIAIDCSPAYELGHQAEMLGLMRIDPDTNVMIETDLARMPGE